MASNGNCQWHAQCVCACACAPLFTSACVPARACHTHLHTYTLRARCTACACTMRGARRVVRCRLACKYRHMHTCTRLPVDSVYTHSCWAHWWASTNCVHAAASPCLSAHVPIDAAARPLCARPPLRRSRWAPLSLSLDALDMGSRGPASPCSLCPIILFGSQHLASSATMPYGIVRTTTVPYTAPCIQTVEEPLDVPLGPDPTSSMPLVARVPPSSDTGAPQAAGGG